MNCSSPGIETINVLSNFLSTVMGEQQNWTNMGSTNAVFPGALFTRATVIFTFWRKRALLSLLTCNSGGEVSTL